MTATNKPTPKVAEKKAEPVAAKPAAKPAVKPAPKAVEKAAPVAAKPAVKPAVKPAPKAVEKAEPVKTVETVAAGPEQVAEVLKSYEDAVVFGKDGLDAVVKANAVFVKGVQDINAALFNLAQTSLEENAANAKKIFACKTVEDVIAVQSDLVKTGFEKTVSESRKITEMSVKVTEEAALPITEQVNAAVEKLTKLAA